MLASWNVECIRLLLAYICAHSFYLFKIVFKAKNIVYGIHHDFAMNYHTQYSVNCSTLHIKIKFGMHKLRLRSNITIFSQIVNKAFPKPNGIWWDGSNQIIPLLLRQNESRLNVSTEQHLLHHWIFGSTQMLQHFLGWSLPISASMDLLKRNEISDVHSILYIVRY